MPDSDKPAETGSDAQAKPAVSPLFYRKPEALEAHRHAGLGVGPHDGYGFAAQVNAAPVNISEFARAGVWYPIVFSGEAFGPVAVLGLRKNQNLFVESDGAWIGGAYIPAYVRRYPYILSRMNGDKDQVMLCVDVASTRVSRDAEPKLFDSDDKATETAHAALEFCMAFQRQALSTEMAVAALRDAGLLMEQQGEIEMPDGEKLRLTDFHVVNEKKLNSLDDDALLDLRKKGALSVAYCQMMSMNCWSRLTHMAQRRGPD